MSTVSFIPSGRGGRKALYRGFIYTNHIDVQTGTYWHCIQRHSDCKGRIKINSAENDIEVVKHHNHLPDFGHSKAVKLVAQAKKRCLEEPHLIPALLTRDAYSGADNETLIALPKENSVKTAIRR